MKQPVNLTWERALGDFVFLSFHVFAMIFFETRNKQLLKLTGKKKMQAKLAL